jgi:tetratricopeptide (TPR) repeat protein
MKRARNTAQPRDQAQAAAAGTRSGWAAAAAIFAVPLAVRLVHVWQIRDAPFFTVLMGDSRACDDWAREIAQGDWLGHEVYYPEAHYNLANALLDRGELDQAIDHFRRAVDSMPGSADVHNNLGIALATRGQSDEAIAEFREALRLAPDSSATHRNLGDALMSRGMHVEAIEHLRRAVQLDPQSRAHKTGSARRPQRA